MGGLLVKINGHVVNDREWGRRKARLLLSLLALYPNAPVSRDLAIKVLWGRSPELQTRNNLNTALTSLRASLRQRSGGVDYIVTSGNNIMLNAQHVVTDVGQFERLARVILSGRAGTRDVDALDACIRVERLFRSGPQSEFEGAPHQVAQRIDELADLYMGCMVLGSELALKSDDVHLGLWFVRSGEVACASGYRVRRTFEKSLRDLRAGLETRERDMRLMAVAS
jgi:hypothetical protein